MYVEYFVVRGCQLLIHRIIICLIFWNSNNDNKRCHSSKKKQF